MSTLNAIRGVEKGDGSIRLCLDLRHLNKLVNVFLGKDCGYTREVGTKVVQDIKALYRLRSEETRTKQGTE
jgi:hypothetical protein